jgi:hypothetical protein
MGLVKLPERWTPMRYHPVQSALERCNARFVGVQAGRGSGKTELSKRRLVRWLPVVKPWRDPRYFFCAPTHEQAKRLAWNDILALIPKDWIASINISEMKIVTVFGSELWVRGLEKPQRMEGVQWDGGVIDESSDIKEGVFDLNIGPALTHRNGWCWRQGVPKRQGVGAKEFNDFCDRAAKGESPDTAFFTWKSSDILTPAQLAYARENLDAKDYREQYEACRETAGGGVFHAFDEQQSVRPVTYDPAKQIIVGSDFNVDPMAWVICHKIDNRLEVFDEIWIRDTNTVKTLDILWARYGQNHKGGWAFYGDAAGQQRKTSAQESDYELIRTDPRFLKAGRQVYYPRANPGVENRFASTNALLCNAAGQRRLYVDPRCKRLIDDLKARHYKPGTREVQDSKDLGHITDALGYAVHWLYPVGGGIFANITEARFGV